MSSVYSSELLTTRKAAKLSGYSQDYIARLLRSRELPGQRVGRTWLVHPDSLSAFLRERQKYNIQRAHSLARVRATEYRLKQPLRSTPIRKAMPAWRAAMYTEASLHDSALFTPGSHLFALAVALMVVAASFFTAQSSLIATYEANFGMLAEGAAAHIHDFISYFGYPVAVSTAVVDPNVRQETYAEAHFFERLHIAENVPAAISVVPSVFERIRIGLVSMTPAQGPAFIPAPALVLRQALNIGAGAVTILDSARSVTVVPFSAYEHFLAISGKNALFLGASVRDSLPGAMNGLGNLVIDGTHASIAIETHSIYFLVHKADLSAESLTKLVMYTGITAYRLSKTTSITALETYRYIAIAAVAAYHENGPLPVRPDQMNASVLRSASNLFTWEIVKVLSHIFPVNSR